MSLMAVVRFYLEGGLLKNVSSCSLHDLYWKTETTFPISFLDPMTLYGHSSSTTVINLFLIEYSVASL